MSKFNLDDYEPVEERIKRFYKDHADGRITADLLSNPDDMGTAVVKAFIYVGEELKSTGLAYEKNGEGYVNKTSHLENCETSAIGRALANFNYAGSKRPSREEMTKASKGAEPKSYPPKETDITEADILTELRNSDLPNSIELEKQYLAKPDGAKPAFAEFIKSQLGGVV